jgi:hypothetical protein
MFNMKTMLLLLSISSYACMAMEKPKSDSKEDIASKILHAHKDPQDAFSTTAVYVHNECDDLFEKQGDLIALNVEQLQAVTQGNNYYYKDSIGEHFTRLADNRQAIGALVFGNDPQLKQKFEKAYQMQTWKVTYIYGFDAHSWKTLVVPR